jgi:predicted TIM-barrel fold metal-dependent hydrolase
MPRIIDMHCHTAGIGVDSSCFVSPAMRRSWKFNLYLKAFGGTLPDIKRHGDAHLVQAISRMIDDSRHVDGAVILAMDGAYSDDGSLDRNKTEFFVDNRFCAEAVAQHDNLYFGASINPLRPNALEELQWCAEHGAVLIKWLPSIQMFDPADKRLAPFYERLRDLKLPLLTHVGDEDSFTGAANELADPQRLRLALETGVTIIAAHVASSGSRDGESNVERLARLFPEFPNLYADISTLTQFNRRRYLAQILADERLHGRLLYGTDHPLTNTPLVSPYQYPLRLGLSGVRAIGREANPWDRDVVLKQRLGFPEDMFAAVTRVLTKIGE